MPRRAVPLLLAVVALAVAAGPAAARGAAPASARVQVLHLRADPGGAMRFDRTVLRARPGLVRIELDNPLTSGEFHTLGVQGHGLDKEGTVSGPGGRSVLVVRVRRGVYGFLCTVGRHAQQGMRGRLIVR